MLIFAVQVVLVILRLDGIVDWPWMLVLSPLLVVIAEILVFGPPISFRYDEIDPEDLPDE